MTSPPIQITFTPDTNGITKGFFGGLGIFMLGVTQLIDNDVDECDIGHGGRRGSSRAR
jgi:hypothetical protein